VKEHLYSKRPNLVIGFHGCDESVMKKVINGQDNLQKSENIYDWLGHGIYFWQNSKSRAMQYALEAQSRPNSKIKKPAVVGAIIDLGHCMDLIDTEFLLELKEGFRALKKSRLAARATLPKNKKVQNSKDKLLRNLDCAVIETVHTLNMETLDCLKKSEKLILEIAFTFKYIYRLNSNDQPLDKNIFDLLVDGILENLDKLIDSLDNAHILNFEKKRILHYIISIMDYRNIYRYKTAEEKLLEMADDIICTARLFSEYDSVRGVFFEGKRLYPGAGFSEKDHIQLCIRNPNCIKGFFLPREIDKIWPNP
jgi:hypothetical protein